MVNNNEHEKGYDECLTLRVIPLEKALYQKERSIVRLKQALAESGGRIMDQHQLIQRLVNALQNAHDRGNGVGGTMHIDEEHAALKEAAKNGTHPLPRL